MRKITLTTVRTLDKAQYLTKSAGTKVDSSSPKLTERFSAIPPPFEGAALPDWAAVQKYNIELLVQTIIASQKATQAYREAKVEMLELQKRRNGMAGQVEGRLRRFRGSVKAAYSTERWHLVGLQEPPEGEATALRERCSDILVHVRDPELLDKLGDPEEGQSAIDFESVGTSLGILYEGFAAIVDDWFEAKKLRDDALVTKNETEDQLKSVYANVARIQEGYFRLAGLDELADRLRLNLKRSSKSEDGEGGEGGGGEPPTDSDPADTTGKSSGS